MIKALLLDLDDTLILEVDYVRSGYRAVSAAFAGRAGVPEERVAEELWAIFESGERRNVLGMWLDRYGLADALPEAIATYRDHRPDISLAPGWSELLEQWRGRFRLGIVTDGIASVQRGKLDAVRAEELVEAVVVSDELGGRDAWKPAPDAYLRACALLGVEPRDAVYVGDNPAKDFLGARGVGMGSIRMDWPAGLHHGVPPVDAAHAPDAVVSTLDELTEAVNRL